MKLTNRDTEIIEWITTNKGATIEQIRILFFPSYDATAKRLHKLAINKFLKVELHPTINKKVYYSKKIPSFHAIALNDFIIKYRDNIKLVQREYKLKKYKIDGIIILKTGKLLIVEIDIFNLTKTEKINGIMQLLGGSGAEFEVWVVGKRERVDKVKGVHYSII